MKRIISFLMIIAMLFTLIPTAFALEKIETGSYVTVNITDVDKKIINGYDATGINDTSTEIVLYVYLDKMPEIVTSEPEWGIAGATVNVSFDKDKLLFKSIKSGMSSKKYDDDNNVVDGGSPSWQTTAATDNNANGTITSSCMNLGGGFTLDSHKSNSALLRIVFTKKEGAKGTANVTLTGLKMGTNCGNDDNDKEYSGEYFNKETCKVILTPTYKVTSTNAAISGTGTEDDPYVYGGTVDVTAAEADASVADPKELDGDLTETVTVNVSAVVPGYKAVVTLDDDTIEVTEPVDSVDGSGDYTFKMPNKNVKANVTYVKRDYTINYVAGTGETDQGQPCVTVNTSSVSATFGSVVNVKDSITLGYKCKISDIVIKQGENDITSSCNVNVESGTFVMPSDNVTVTVDGAQELNGYNVTYSDVADDNYTVSDLEPLITEGVKKTFTVTPDAGYDVAVTSADVEITSKGNNQYEFTMPAKDINITITATKHKYALDIETNTGITVTDLDIANGGKIEFFAENGSALTTASVGDKVRFKVTPPTGKSVKEVTTTKTELNLTLVDSILFEVAQIYSIDFPADSVIPLAVVYESAETDLTKVTLTYDGKVQTGTDPATYGYQPQTVEINEITKKMTPNLTVFLDPLADLTTYPERALTISTEQSANADVKVFVGKPDAEGNGTEYDNKGTIPANTTQEYTIRVTAQDGQTYDDYTLIVKNTTDPAGGASIELVSAGNDTTPVVAVGDDYEATIVAKGFNGLGGANGVRLTLQLPYNVIANADSNFAITVLPGDDIANNSIFSPNYNATTGELSLLIVNGGGDDFTNAEDATADEFELAKLSFGIRDDIDLTDPAQADEFDITWTLAAYGDGSEGAEKSFGASAYPEKVALERAAETILAEKIAQINALAKETDYSQQKWDNEILPILNGAILALDTAADEAAMDAIVAQAANDVTGVQKLVIDGKDNNDTPADTTDDIDVPAFKTVISADDYILGDYKAADYLDGETGADWTAIMAIVTATQGKITDSKSNDEDVLERIVTDAQAEMAKVATLAQHKADAVAEIEAMYDKADYTDEGAAKIDTAIAAAKSSLSEASVTTTAGIEAVKTAFKQTVDALDGTDDSDVLADVRAENKTDIDELVSGGTLKFVDETTEAVTALEKTNYTDDNWDKIALYQSIAKVKIDMATSEAAMDAIVKETQTKIAAVKTLDQAERDALQKINDADDSTGYTIDDIITAAGTDYAGKINVYKEALYEAAIEEAKDDNGDTPISKTQLQAAIDKANTLGFSLRGDFNVSNTVDIQDPTGCMKYVCRKLEYVPQVQGIINADLHTPGDGVLTVFDVVEILDEIGNTLTVQP